MLPKRQEKRLANTDSQKLPVEMPALDTILEHVDISGEVPLGLVDIPTELIVAQRPVGALLSFAAQLYADPWRKHRVAAKWSSLCDAHLKEGIVILSWHTNT